MNGEPRLVHRVEKEDIYTYYSFKQDYLKDKIDQHLLSDPEIKFRL